MKKEKMNYNHGNSIAELYDALPIFSFNSSETKHNYY